MFLIIIGIVGMLATTGASAVKMNVKDTLKTATLGNPQIFEYYLGSMYIDGDLEEPCQVDINCVGNKFQDIQNPPYNTGDTIKLTADYEIITDNMSAWDEGPNGPELPESIHPNCLEQWVFSIIVQEYDGQKWLTIERETEKIQDLPEDSPDEKLTVVAPSKVVKDTDFDALVLFHKDPTYEYWGRQEKINFDEEEYLVDKVTGIAVLTAPDSTGEYTLEASKNWKTDPPNNWGSEEDLFTYGETTTTVVDSISSSQLIVYAPSSALEGETFEVLVKADGSPLSGVTVEIDSQTYTTNSNGLVTIDTPSVSQNTDFTISASKSGYISETAEIEILYDPDVEDNSGDSGTITLEFDLERDQFWDDYPMRLRFKLECEQGVWNWNNHPHWYDDHGWDSDYGDLKVYTTNDAPVNVEFSGPATGKVGTPVEFTAKATDPDGDHIMYWFDWDGDGVAYEFDSYGYYPSGQKITVKHTFTEKFEGTIYVCAEDGLGGETWEPLEIKITKTRSRNTELNDFLSKLSNKYPLLSQLFEKLLDLR